MTKEEWIISGETGLSSKTIWAHFMANSSPKWPCEPSDPSDFLRCFWLLKLAPEWRERIGELGARYERWKPLTDNWDLLEKMLIDAWPKSCASGKYEKEPPAFAMYDKMKELQGVSRKAHP